MATRHIVTRSSLKGMIEQADPERRERIVGRALLCLLRRQTTDEVRATDTHHTNMRGFSKPDARQGILTAQYFRKYRMLEQWQMDRWLKPWRGTYRICKYWRQLDEEAHKKLQTTGNQS